MQTKHVIVATLVIVMGMAWAGSASAGPLKKRMQNQHHRIRDGVASGELTYREARQLRRHHRVTRRLRNYFLSDGHLTHRERRILHRRLDRNSDRIYAYKHDRDYRYPRRWRAHAYY
ncbi:MAG: hypothetical protein QNJ61_04250 [Desulfobacterales bacterium]|nr:hypothetical protein [Desulfobacterales bacterium]